MARGSKPFWTKALIGTIALGMAGAVLTRVTGLGLQAVETTQKEAADLSVLVLKTPARSLDEAKSRYEVFESLTKVWWVNVLDITGIFDRARRTTTEQLHAFEAAKREEDERQARTRAQQEEQARQEAVLLAQRAQDSQERARAADEARAKRFADFDDRNFGISR